MSLQKILHNNDTCNIKETIVLLEQKNFEMNPCNTWTIIKNESNSWRKIDGKAKRKFMRCIHEDSDTDS